MSDPNEEDLVQSSSTTTSTVTTSNSGQASINSPAPDKIIVYFKNAGGAQALKQKKFKLQSNLSFQNVIDKLRSQLKLKSTDSLFLFVNQVFQPSPDESLGELYKCFSHNEQLIINYSDLPAWG
ncbi:autophagy protein 12 [Tieghemostelium lacteum]|uniref:Ubiquitin-like protein ATG12 n=1 Tax=Tieghemostelium lacteum TaxID=361077 RepID=A0A151Z3J6_TIELA|nr:autophagy protein 12 [Tieghemostelium lacteum]|eukprot:KYQ88530.1 autophagy protein 12 [Tieghemostelium lacteum]